MIHNAGCKKLKYKLSPNARLDYDESTENYFLFRIDSGAHYRLNKMGYVIWLMLEEGKSHKDIVKKISETLLAGSKTCTEEINDFLNFLLANKLITV